MTKLKQQIEEMRAGATKPSCFQDILDLQKKLDEILEPRQTRPRTLTDICLSAVAECIEFNEETRESHKTWKGKPFNEVEVKKEAIDILFFFAQMLNHAGINEDSLDEIKVYFRRNIEEIHLYRRYYSLVESVLMLTRTFSSLGLLERRKKLSKEDLYNECFWISLDLGKVYGLLKMDYEEVLAMYWDKWNENLDRIGKEWN